MDDPSRPPYLPPDDQPAPDRERRGTPGWLWWVAGAVIGGWLLLSLLTPRGPVAGNVVPYSGLISQVQAGQVAAVTITGQQLTGSFRAPQRWVAGRWLPPDEPTPVAETTPLQTGTAFRTTLPPAAADQLLPLLLAAGVSVSAVEESGFSLGGLLLSLLPWLLFLGVMVFFWLRTSAAAGQQPNVLGFGRSRPRRHDPERPTVTFADVAGEEEAKTGLLQVVDFLKRPGRYHALGARLPRGVLLVGPPGTGKTLLARAVAGEAGVPFFSISAAEFVEMFVGVGASRVRDLFTQANRAAPAIVFVDELDAVGRQRGAGLGGGNDEREQTLNQLLTEMDGFDPRRNVVVIAATNRPDVLDPALLRPGRFDRQVTVGLPDRRGREAILRVHTRGVPVAATVDLAAVAAATPGFSGADLANLINEAALLAARTGKRTVEQAELDRALDQIVLGAERPLLLSAGERRLVAYHEAGHALVAALTPGADPPHKVSIIARGRALGVMLQTPAEERFTQGRTQLQGRLAILLAGRAAERLIFGETSSGAENDLKEATSLARRMVGLWGMSEAIGPVFLGSGEQHVFLGREITQEREVGTALLNRADAAVRQLLDEAGQRATRLLVGQRPALDRLARALLAEETVEREQLQALLAEPPAAAAS